MARKGSPSGAAAFGTWLDNEANGFGHRPLGGTDMHAAHTLCPGTQQPAGTA